MKEQLFRVIFSGKLKAGTRPEEVRTKLTELFNLKPYDNRHREKLIRLFSGRPVVIKQGISQSRAQRYVEAIGRCGGVCSIEQLPGAKPADSAPNGIERRKHNRRIRADRRAVQRNNAIVPDRRHGVGRRLTDQLAFSPA